MTDTTDNGPGRHGRTPWQPSRRGLLAGAAAGLVAAGSGDALAQAPRKPITANPANQPPNVPDW